MKATPINKFAASAFAACAALALLGSTANSEAAAYMKLGDIKGEAQADGHKEWIIIESMSSPMFRAPVTDPSTGVTRNSGVLVLGDVVCTKKLDKASHKLAEHVCTGISIPEVEIHFTVEVQVTDADGTIRTAEQPYFIYKLKDVIISSYSFNGHASGDSLPTEQFSLNYAKVEWTYVVLDPATKAPTGEVITGSCPQTPSAP